MKPKLRRRQSVAAARSRLSPVSRRSMPPDPMIMARWLLGKRVVRIVDGTASGGRIVETEAYLSDDPASHSFGGETPRNRSMFRARGHAYVYRIYGKWFCLNVSAGAAGEGAAVLIRALAPECGVDAMCERRGGAAVRDLARGPGRLCAALGVDLALDGIDLCSSNGSLWLTNGEAPTSEIGVSARVGITRAAQAPLRFYERGHLCVSGPTRLRT